LHAPPAHLERISPWGFDERRNKSDQRAVETTILAAQSLWKIGYEHAADPIAKPSA
jgi:hypothetical protein